MFWSNPEDDLRQWVKLKLRNINVLHLAHSDYADSHRKFKVSSLFKL